VRQINLSVPKPLYEYLTALAVRTPFGPSETDAALYLLKSGIERMVEKRFHDLEWPKNNKDENPE
jgi:hypothetical protein